MNHHSSATARLAGGRGSCAAKPLKAQGSAGASSSRDERRGFTLIELLVVISLMAVLAALAVAFLPTAATTATEARAGQQVQGWLNIAKQRALRDQAPRGLRLWITAPPGFLAGSTTLPLAVTDCQYIEQPDDFPGSQSVQTASGLPTPPPSAGGYTVQNCLFINTDLLNGYPAPLIAAGGGNSGDPNIQYWSVQPGDYLEVLGSGLVHQIIQIGVPDGNGVTQPNFIVVMPPLPFPISATANFRIARAPRLAGEDTLKLPEGTIIDLQTNAAFSNPLPVVSNYVDILFAPSGEVISPPMASSNIHLWVRTPSPGDPTNPLRGDPTLVSIFTKTGFVGAFPPAGGGNPYALVR